MKRLASNEFNSCPFKSQRNCNGLVPFMALHVRKNDDPSGCLNCAINGNNFGVSNYQEEKKLFN